MADPTASNRPKSGVRATRSHVCLLFVASTIFGSLSSGCFLWTTRGEGDQISERVQKQAGRLELSVPV